MFYAVVLKYPVVPRRDRVLSVTDWPVLNHRENRGTLEIPCVKMSRLNSPVEFPKNETRRSHEAINFACLFSEA